MSAPMMIVDGNGNALTNGLESHLVSDQARQTAQRMANARGESVWLCWSSEDEDEDEDEYSGNGVEVEPDPVVGDAAASVVEVEVTYRVQLVSATSEGNWASQCDGQTYPTRAAAQAAIDADPTTRPDGLGGSCVVEIVEVAS